jgi:rRNA pseudouridine-1189 N-methylase Emg1 (Nep1/Mra1 family)
MLAVMSKKKAPAGEKKPKPPVLYLRVSEEHEAALQAFISAQRIKPDRTAVGLTALEELLAKEGFWPPKPPR